MGRTTRRLGEPFILGGGSPLSCGPISICAWPGAAANRAALLQAVERSQDAHPDSALDVGTGWSGPKDLFDDGTTFSLVAWLQTILPQLPLQWRIHGWGNVMQEGDEVRSHNHRRSHLGGANVWAGVYYLEIPPGSSALETELGPVPARDGLAITFPADLTHWVRPQPVRARRVSIGFNVRPV